MLYLNAGHILVFACGCVIRMNSIGCFRHMWIYSAPDGVVYLHDNVRLATFRIASSYKYLAKKTEHHRRVGGRIRHSPRAHFRRVLTRFILYCSSMKLASIGGQRLLIVENFGPMATSHKYATVVANDLLVFIIPAFFTSAYSGESTFTNEVDPLKSDSQLWLWQTSGASATRSIGFHHPFPPTG